MSARTPSAEKRRRFIAEYLRDLNATEAATRAGYSAATAYSAGWRLLKRPDVREQIQKAMDKRAEKTQITAEYVLEGIKAVTQAAVERGEAANALRGYELMGKHLKLFTDKIEQKQETTIKGYIVVPAKADLEPDA